MEKEVYCIGDVIRIRRHMLGMSRAELCENICSEKTLRRLENNQLKTQRAIVLDLFDRLGLAAEYCRTELITDSLEAIECMDELRTCIRNWECDRADELIQRIEKLVSMEHPSNRQVILHYQTINRLHQGAVTNEEFCHGLIKTLECTLLLKAAMSSGEKYITNEETLCIQNIASHSNGTKERKQRYLDVLCERYRFYEENGIVASFINMYEIVMEYVMSELGNMGEYDQSDKISRIVLKECLHSRRIYGIYKSIYNIWWNNKQQQKEGILLKNRCNQQTDLRICIALSEFCKNKRQTDFYRRKLVVSDEK